MKLTDATVDMRVPFTFCFWIFSNFQAADGSVIHLYDATGHLDVMGEYYYYYYLYVLFLFWCLFAFWLSFLVEDLCFCCLIFFYVVCFNNFLPSFFPIHLWTRTLFMAESYENYGAKSDVNCLRIEFRLHDLLHEESLTFMSSSFPNIDVIETELNHDTKHLTSIIGNEIDPAISPTFGAN